MKLVANLALLASLVANCAAAGQVVLTADEVLEKNFAALGGRAKVSAVRTLRFTATQWAGGALGKSLPVTVFWKRPDRLRIETPEEGLLKVQAFDGAIAWETYPQLTGFEPQTLEAGERDALRDQADLVEGPTFNYAAKGHKIELVGKESLDGRTAWHLILTTAGGELRSLWFDGESFLQVREERTGWLGDREVTTISKFSDFRRAGGLLFAYRTETRLRQQGEPPDGLGEPSLFTIDRIEIDVELPDALFSLPAPPAKPAPAADAADAGKGGAAGRR